MSVQGRVESAARQQRRRRSLLQDAAVAQHDDPVGVAQGGEPMRDHEARPAREQGSHRALDLGLGRRIDARGRLVEDQDGGVDDQRARDAQQLALAKRQVLPALVEWGVVAEC